MVERVEDEEENCAMATRATGRAAGRRAMRATALVDAIMVAVGVVCAVVVDNNKVEMNTDIFQRSFKVRAAIREPLTPGSITWDFHFTWQPRSVPG